MKYDLIIWDFNGTIADDIEIGIEAVNCVMERRGMKPITDIGYYRSMFCFPIKKYYEKLGFDFDKEPYEVPALEWVAEYLSREDRIKLMPGCKEALGYIKAKGIPQIIISSSEITMLERELSMLGVRQYFDAVLGLDNTYAGGKTDIAKEWAKGKEHLALMIGDSVHDHECAKAVGADCILYSGGHDLPSRLEKCGVPVIDDLSKLSEYID